MEAQARSPPQWIKGPGIATAAVEVTAVAKIQSLVRELPYAMVPSLKKENIFNICIFMMSWCGPVWVLYSRNFTEYCLPSDNGNTQKSLYIKKEKTKPVILINSVLT